MKSFGDFDDEYEDVSFRAMMPIIKREKEERTDNREEKFLKLFKKVIVEKGCENFIRDMYEDLKNKYSRKGRFYHNLSHVMSGLNELKEVKNLSKNPDTLEFAWWYHDIIYNVRAKNNEKESADYAKEVCRHTNLKLGCVQDLILATDHKRELKTLDEKLIVDVDLSIFGKSTDVFFKYEKNIRKEYSFVEEDAYKEGRTQIIKTFLDKSHIYNTDYFREKYESAARKNLKILIDFLKN